MSTKKITRRTFVKNAAAAAGGCAVASPLVVPGRALGNSGAVAPSERITLGSIGVGMMGRGHLRFFSQYPGAQVVGVCDVDQWRRENAKTTVETTYAANAAGGKFRGCTAYRDLRELLARTDLDAVVIATGDNWHGLATVLAAKAGKDIYCEKPISLSIDEARAMVATTERYDRVCQIGLQQRSTPEFRKACSLVKGGRIGKVKCVYVGHPGTSRAVNLPSEPVPEGLDWDQWLGPAPWRPFNRRFHIYGQPPHVVPWHFCPDFGGGNLTSNAVHAFDVVQWGLGMDESGPLEIIPPETGEVPSLTYKYAGGVVLQVEWKLDPKKHFVPEGWNVSTTLKPFGALFVGEEGWIHVGRQGFLEGFPAGIVDRPARGNEDWHPVNNHHQDWLESIKARSRPACDVAIGCRSTTVAHLGCIAHRTGRALRWDPVGERFLDDDEANRLCGRSMREPWRL